MGIADCAGLVERGDPARFMAVMAAPLWMREILFPLYAFNLEVARIPWLTGQPLIAEMRLQWWREVVENAAAAPQSPHEVAGPLQALIRDAGLPVPVLVRLIEARRHDAWGEPFADEEALAEYLEATGAGLMWLAVRALGAPAEAEAPVRAHGWAAGLANYLQAVAELAARGRRPLPDPEPAAVAALARRGLDRLAQARAARGRVPRALAPALLAGWQAAPLLRLAAHEPARVAAGGLVLAPFALHRRLVWQRLTGRW